MVTADPIELPPEELVTVTVQNLLDEPDKATLYHNEYPELPVNEYTWWSEDSLVNDRSRGRLFRDPSEPFATPLGDDAEALERIDAAKASSDRPRPNSKTRPFMRFCAVAASATSV